MPARSSSGSASCLLVLPTSLAQAARSHLPVDLAPLHAKIGQLARETDFLERALTKADLLSAKP